mmetsp:Transcript_8239/g.15592  ORF Transcript_8239/g.15592 Transcript_8239/m.15592 type:complete len:332 (-) Transcript_8239:22-1017(-)
MAKLALFTALLVHRATSASSGTATIKLRNGKEMPMLAAGVWQYNVSVAYSSVSAALKVGFTSIDTALDYNNQQGVGQAIRDSGVPRSEIFLQTKVPGCGMPGNPFTCYADTKKNLAKDLELLGLDYVDSVIIHFPPLPSFIVRSCGELTGSCEMVRSQWKAMEEFYNAGKAKAIGVSNYCPSCFECLKKAEVFPMTNQVMFHVGMGPHSGFDEIMAYGKSHGVVTQAYSVLGNTPWGQHANDDILHGDTTTAIAKHHNKSAVEVALKYVVDKGVPAVTKSNNPAHLASDLGIFDWNMTASEMATLDNYMTPGSHTVGSMRIPHEGFSDHQK